jgi:outer membrane protein assembly factor BamB
MLKKLNILLLFAGILVLASCSSSKDFVLKQEIIPKVSNSALHPPVSASKIANIDDVGYKADMFIEDGVIYIGNLKGEVYAVNIKTHKKSKIIALKNEHIEAAPYVRGEFIYVGTTKGNLYKIDYIQRKIIAKKSFDFPVMNRIYSKNGILYAISEDDNIYALDPDDLGVIWRYSNGSPSVLDIRSTSGIHFGDNGMYAGFSDGSVSKISYYGDRIWSEQVGDGSMFIDVDSTPKGDKELFVSSVGGYTKALELDDGSVLWKRKISSYSNIEKNIYGLFLADENGDVIALDNDNGETMWKKRVTQDGNVYSIKLIDSSVYAMTSHGVLVVLDALKGKIMDIVDIGDEFSSCMTVHDNSLYVVSRIGDLYSIKSKK